MSGRTSRSSGWSFLRWMKKSGEEYSGGDILDPDTGVVYRCKLPDGGAGRKLVVSGIYRRDAVRAVADLDPRRIKVVVTLPAFFPDRTVPTKNS